jgi:Xaa-Pro aminopeptidase
MSKSGVFFVTDELQQVLDNLPADEPRSRLEPFRAFILRWRREGRSYERIRKILLKECRVKVSVSTLFKFVQRRSRPRKLQAEVDPGLDRCPQVVDQPVIMKPRTRKTPEEIAAMREAAKSSNHKPAFQAKEETKPLFVYDPDRPLTNKSSRKEN